MIKASCLHQTRACLVGPVVQKGPGEAGDEVEAKAVDGQAVPNHHCDNIVYVGPVFVKVSDEELEYDFDLQGRVQAAAVLESGAGNKAQPVVGVALPTGD